MTTNLFTYATKELSQDAFICWLLANYNAEDLQDEAYRFINLLMGENFLVGDIKAMTIKQQLKKIDIVIDFWTSSTKSRDSHYVIALEDKTTSSAHDEQLIKYNKVIDEWNMEEPGFKTRTKKVFFKSDVLSDQDEKEINNANKKTSIEWKKLDINDLYSGFFKDAKKTKSEVFNMYVAHFMKLYHDIKLPPKSQPSSWNFNNWMRFFESLFEEEYKEKYHGSSCDTSIYRGMYPSLRVSYPLDSECDFYATFEIIKRENLRPYLRPGFRYKLFENKEYSWVWSIKEINGDIPFKELSAERLTSLRKYVSENGRGLFRYAGTSRSFAKIDKDKHISYDEKTIEQLKFELKIWLDTFFAVLSQYKKQIKQNMNDKNKSK